MPRVQQNVQAEARSHPASWLPTRARRAEVPLSVREHRQSKGREMHVDIQTARQPPRPPETKTQGLNHERPGDVGLSRHGEGYGGVECLLRPSTQYSRNLTTFTRYEERSRQLRAIGRQRDDPTAFPLAVIQGVVRPRVRSAALSRMPRSLWPWLHHPRARQPVESWLPCRFFHRYDEAVAAAPFHHSDTNSSRFPHHRRSHGTSTAYQILPSIPARKVRGP